jgi:penicillin amidase
MIDRTRCPLDARTAASALAIAVALLAAGCRGGAPPSHDARATSPGVLVEPALSAPVRLLTDRNGIPHLEAANLPDLYFAWGWVTARDRLWQLELTRLQAEGHSFEWLGNSALRGDGGAQLFRFEERARAIWARDRTNPEVRMALERYTAGINARIAEVREGRAPLPPELASLAQAPRDWRPEDTIMTLLGLGITLDLDLPELSEADDIREHGRDWTQARRRFEGDWIYDTIPDSATGHRWESVTGSPAAEDGTPAGTAGAHADVSPSLLAEARASLTALRGTEGGEDGRASDCLVVGAKRSASGFPLLANDPHLSLLAPGYLHLVHLSVPGVCNAIGAAVPGLPAIVSGRNLRCAWGVTALGADVADVVADSVSRDGRRVLWRNRWIPIEAHPYRMTYHLIGMPVPVWGQMRRYTPEGPVLVFDPRHGRALSLRWSAFEDARISLSRLIGVERSTSAGELAERYRSLVTPTINLMAADVLGDVRYQACGLIPRRLSDPGPGPIPGGGTSPWPGYIASDSMPSWRVPAKRFAVNGNNRPLAHYPYVLPRYNWAHDRALRMAARLGGDASLTAADLASIQNDVHSRAAERFVPALIACADSLPDSLDARERAALDTLRSWDFLARRSRVAPTLYRAWLGALTRRSRTDGLPGLTLAALEGRAPDALRAPGGEAPERAALAAIRALSLALDTLAVRLGPDLAGWSWARSHRAHFRHILAAAGGRDARWEPPLTPVDGDNSTPCVGPSRLPWSFEVTHAPVFRHVVDLANPLWSWAVVPPGNAAGGQDQLDRWANHGYVPLYLDWALVAASRPDSLILVPAGR